MRRVKRPRLPLPKAEQSRIQEEIFERLAALDLKHLIGIQLFTVTLISAGLSGLRPGWPRGRKAQARRGA